MVFVVGESGGVWGQAVQQPGLAALNVGKFATSDSVSCSAPGDCGTAGDYSGAGQYTYPYAATETNGTWHSAATLGTSSLGTSDVGITAISCAAPGDCDVSGGLTLSGNVGQVAVATETGGIWGALKKLPGYGSLSHSAGEATSVSCAAPGDCATGGWYTDASNFLEVFVADQTGGTWGNAGEVPGSGSLGENGAVTLTAVSCPAAGRCAAGGGYFFDQPDNTGNEPAFVVSQP